MGPPLNFPLLEVLRIETSEIELRIVYEFVLDLKWHRLCARSKDHSTFERCGKPLKFNGPKTPLLVYLFGAQSDHNWTPSFFTYSEPKATVYSAFNFMFNPSRIEEPKHSKQRILYLTKQPWTQGGVHLSCSNSIKNVGLSSLVITINYSKYASLRLHILILSLGRLYMVKLKNMNRCSSHEHSRAPNLNANEFHMTKFQKFVSPLRFKDLKPN